MRACSSTGSLAWTRTKTRSLLVLPHPSLQLFQPSFRFGFRIQGVEIVELRVIGRAGPEVEIVDFAFGPVLRIIVLDRAFHPVELIEEFVGAADTAPRPLAACACGEGIPVLDRLFDRGQHVLHLCPPALEFFVEDVGLLLEDSVAVFVLDRILRRDVGRLLIVDLSSHALSPAARLGALGFLLDLPECGLDFGFEPAYVGLGVGGLFLHSAKESIDGLGNVVAAEFFLEVVDRFVKGTAQVIEHYQRYYRPGGLPGPERSCGMRSVQEGFNALGERVPSPVQSALDRAEVHTGDLGDLLIALPLEFPETEDQPMVLRQLLDSFLHQAT